MPKKSEKPKVAIIGCGQVGTQAATFLAVTTETSIILYDVVEGLARGRAIDLSQAAYPAGFKTRIEAADSFEEILDANIFIITAGKARLPGMSRSDLINMNTEILLDIIEKLSFSRREAVFVVVTNPLDVMVSLFVKESGRERTKVLGMGGILDSARLAYFISQETGISPLEIEPWVIGAHSDTMVPCFSITKIRGESADKVLTGKQKIEIAEKTKYGGAEIVSYLKTGSAFLAPGASIARLVKAIVEDEKSLMPVSVFLQGEYGLEGAAIGVPVIVGKDGVEKIVELKISLSEYQALKKSFEEVKELLSKVN